MLPINSDGHVTYQFINLLPLRRMSWLFLGKDSPFPVLQFFCEIFEFLCGKKQRKQLYMVIVFDILNYTFYSFKNRGFDNSIFFFQDKSYLTLDIIFHYRFFEFFVADFGHSNSSPLLVLLYLIQTERYNFSIPEHLFCPFLVIRLFFYMKKPGN